MIAETPFIQGLMAESKREGTAEAILYVLQGKFGPVGPDIAAGLAQLKEEKKLLRLALHASTCTSLQAFAEHLREELPAPAPQSTRGKRRTRKSSE